jgi:hypothetical protein
MQHKVLKARGMGYVKQTLEPERKRLRNGDPLQAQLLRCLCCFQHFAPSVLRTFLLLLVSLFL